MLFQKSDKYSIELFKFICVKITGELDADGGLLIPVVNNWGSNPSNMLVWITLSKIILS